MSLNYRYMLLYFWVTLLGYILVLNLILYLNQQQLYFYHAYKQYGDLIYMRKHHFFLQNMYLVIMLPVFVISPMFGKILLIFKNQDEVIPSFSIYTLAKVIGLIVFVGLYVQSLIAPSVEPSQVMAWVVLPFFFIFMIHQFQKETKRA